MRIKKLVAIAVLGGVVGCVANEILDSNNSGYDKPSPRDDNGFIYNNGDVYKPSLIELNGDCGASPCIKGY